MFVRKSHKILSSKVLLEIYPSSKSSVKIALLFLFIFIGLALPLAFFVPGIFHKIIIFITCPFAIYFLLNDLMNLDKPISFTETGITKPGIFSARWSEISGYGFSYPVARQRARLMQLESNHFPYHMRWFKLPYILHQRGFGFTEENISKIENIMKSQGIKKIS